jgi:hypothetical protein
MEDIFSEKPIIKLYRKFLFGNGCTQIIRINEKENNYPWLSAKICIQLNLKSV